MECRRAGRVFRAEGLEELVAEIGPRFGVRTAAGLVRKSLALAVACGREADADGAVTFLPPGGRPVKVMLRD